MANPATVGFFGAGNPSILAQQRQMQLQQQIADMLTKAGTEQSQTEFAGGLAVPQSPMVGLGKMAQTISGAYINKKNQDLANKLAVDSYNAQGAGFGATPYPSAAPADDKGTMLSRFADSIMGDTPTDPNAVTPGAVAPSPTAGLGGGNLSAPPPVSSGTLGTALATQQATQPQSTPLKLDGFTGDESRNLAVSNPEAYARLLENQLGKTDQMKNDAYQHISPEARRSLTMTEGAKNAGVSGGQYNADALGNPSITPIPGAADTAAGFTKAQEDVKIIPGQTVTDSSGKVMTGVPIRGNGQIIKPQVPPGALAAGLTGNPQPIAPAPISDANANTINSLYPPNPSAPQSAITPSAPAIGANVPAPAPVSPAPAVPAAFGVDPAAQKQKEAESAAMGAAQVKARVEAIQSRENHNKLAPNFDALKQLNNDVPDNRYGIPPSIKAFASSANPIGDGKWAGAHAAWETVNKQQALNALGQLASSGQIRVTRTIQKMIETGNVVPENLQPDERLKLIGIMQKEWENQATSAENVSAKLNGGQVQPYVATVPNNGQAPAPTNMPPNAKQAPDGNYYVPDPNRSGKYLQVQQ